MTATERAPRSDDVAWGDPAPRQFVEDSDWLSEHMEELTDEYPDQWVAVVGGRVAAAGDDASQVYRTASEKTGRGNFPMWLMETRPRLYGFRR